MSPQSTYENAWVDPQGQVQMSRSKSAFYESHAPLTQLLEPDH